MSDDIEGEKNISLPSDYGFVGQDGWERAPGNGWEYEPTPTRTRTRTTWRDRLRIVLRRITRR